MTPQEPQKAQKAQDAQKAHPAKTGLQLSFLLPIIGFMALAIIAAIALFSTLSGTRDVSQLPSVMVGKPVPETNLPLLEGGKSLDLTAFRGKPLLINFFASWCAPCRAEAPALALLSRDVTIVAIAYKDKQADTISFLTQYGNPFAAVAMDYDGQAGLKWGVYGVPETYLVGPDGRIVLRHAGPIDRRVIDNEIMPAIKALQ